MTNADLDAFAARWDLGAPVSMDDLVQIKAELDKLKTIGMVTELVLRRDQDGEYVDLVYGWAALGQTPTRRRLDVRGTAPLAPGIAAMINARAAAVK